MKEKLQGDLKTAMKAGEKLRLMTIRGVLAEVTRLEKDVRRDANDDEIVQVIKRERARRDESLDFARRGKRADLVTQYEAEAKILESYLPAAVGDEELSAAVAAQMAAGVNQIGPIMKALRDQFGARLDGKMASAAVKAAIAPR
ncbi:MAG TPA: GatB/YqeY domain-containing protein [Candidatus Binataceae bacterium]|nr:GatB/YqeY domain-containing protein [Candidatus Binataceae bacterium]